MSEVLFISGSARSKGNTHKAIVQICQGEQVDVLELLHYQIGYYEYGSTIKQDEFWDVVRKMLRYETIVLATPVYWYAMSAIMKNFLDRFTELRNIRKDLGGNLRNRKLFLLTSSSQNHLPQGFDVPFKGWAKDFGMVYKGNLHTWNTHGGLPDVLTDRVHNFRNKIFAGTWQKPSLASQSSRMVY